MDGWGLLFGRIIGLNGHIREIGEGYAVVLSAGVAILGWYISSCRAVINLRREKAHEYVLGHKDTYLKATVDLGTHLKDRKQFPEFSPNGRQSKIHSSLKPLLADLEILAADIRIGLASERFIRFSQKRLLINLFECSRNYIIKFREVRNHPTAYQNFEHVYIRFKFCKYSVIMRLFEWCSNRPLYLWSMISFLAKYKLLSGFFGWNVNWMNEKPDEVRDSIYALDKTIMLISFWGFSYFIFV